MDKKSTKPTLRRIKTQKKRACTVSTPTSGKLADQLEYALCAHQTELEMQNEVLRRLHRKLAHSHDRYEDLYNFAPVGYFTLTGDGMVGDVNFTGAEILKVKRKQMHRYHFSHFVTTKDRTSWHQFLSAVCQGGRQSCNLALQRLDFSVFQARLDGLYLKARKNSPAMVRLILTDISERKQTEDALTLSESRFRGAFETAAHGMALVSPSGRFLKVNQALCAIMGYGEEALRSIDFQTITHAEDLESDLIYVRQLLAGTISSYQMEKRYLHKDGHIIWVLLSVSLVRDENKNPVHFVAQIQDITSHKIAEAELNNAKKQLEMQVDCINRIQSLFIEGSDAVIIFDAVLMEVLKLSASPIGFISEVREDEQRGTCLQNLAISNIAWDPPSRDFYEENVSSGLCFTSLHGLYAEPWVTGQPVIANDPATDPRRWGLPAGHPALLAFLGIPIKRGETIVGVLGLANRPQGYDMELVTYLEPLTAVCAQLIEGDRNRRRRIEAERSMQEANVRLTEEIQVREQLQVALQEKHVKLTLSEKRYKSLTENLSEMIYRADAQTHQISYVNSAVERIHGYAPDEWIKTPELWEQSIHPDDREQVFHALIVAREKGVNGTIEYRIVHRDGTIRWVINSFSWEKNVDGQLEALNGVLYDITERKHAERMLLVESRISHIFATVADNELFEHVLESVLEIMDTPFGLFGYLAEDGSLWIPSMSWNIWDQCQVMNKTLRFPQETWGGSSWGRALLEKKGNYTNALSTRTPEGHLQIQRHISMPILFQDNAIGLLLVANRMTDYTADDFLILQTFAERISPLLHGRLRREQAELLLRESNERYECAVNGSCDGIWDWNLITGAFYMSPRWKQLLGYQDHELPVVSASFFDRIHPDDRTMVHETLQTHWEKRNPFEIESRLQCKNGDYRWFSARGQAKWDEEGNPIRMAGSMTDITQRKEIELSVQENERWLRVIIERAPFGIIEVDTEESIRVFNKTAEHLFGYDRIEIIGKDVSVLIPLDLRSAHHDGFRRFLQTGESKIIDKCSVELEAMRKDGIRFPIRLAINQIILEGKQSFVGMFSDISEEKHLQAELLQSEKMAGLGNMVAGVAHEINTPVGIGVTAVTEMEERTRLFVQLLDQEGISEEELKAYIASSIRLAALIRINLDRAADLVRSFKSVAVDQSSEELRVFKVRSYVESAVLTLQHELKHTHLTIEVICDDDLEIRSHPGAFSQIVINLISNSRIHAFGPDEVGTITLEFHVAGGRLEFVYRDNGKGMSEETRARIFEPFFTTRRDLGGSGLGMHIVYNLVTRTLGGTIFCQSKLGAGISVYMDMPILH
ncbi:MAG: PAS domain S-box protein [Magnetococcales bacterium]|nr:PAS domain S-box protein [Magnetococcales bacterium]